MLDEPAAFLTKLRCNLCQPYRGLDGFDLTEERPNAAELVVPPVLEQPSRLRGHMPLLGVRQRTPDVDALPQFVDDRRRVVLLLLGRKALALIEHNVALSWRLLPLLRFRDRRDEFGTATPLADVPGGLTGRVEFPMSNGILVGRVEDRLLEEPIVHFVEFARF